MMVAALHACYQAGHIDFEYMKMNSLVSESGNMSNLKVLQQRTKRSVICLS